MLFFFYCKIAQSQFTSVLNYIDNSIIISGIVNDRGKTYGIYAVSVGRKYESTGFVDKWHVYRRYSDFHDLHSKIKEKVL